MIDTYLVNIHARPALTEGGAIERVDDAVADIQSLPSVFNVELALAWHTFNRPEAGHKHTGHDWSQPAAAEHFRRRMSEIGVAPMFYVFPFQWAKQHGDQAREKMTELFKRRHAEGWGGVYFDGLPPVGDPYKSYQTRDMIDQANDAIVEWVELFPDWRWWLHDSVSTEVHLFHRYMDVWLSGEGLPSGKGATPWRHINGDIVGDPTAEKTMELMATSGACPSWKRNSSNQTTLDRTDQWFERSLCSVRAGGSAAFMDRAQLSEEQMSHLVDARRKVLGLA